MSSETSQDSSDVFLDEAYMIGAFSDCIAEGASLTKDGLAYSLVFPNAEDEGIRLQCILDKDSVELISNIDGLSGAIPLDEFLESLDIIIAKVLSLNDGIDRGV